MQLARQLPTRYTFIAPLLRRQPKDIRQDRLVKAGLIALILSIMGYVFAMEFATSLHLPGITVRFGEKEFTTLNLTGVLGWLSIVGLMVVLKVYHDRDHGRLFLTEKGIYVARKGFTRLGYSLHQVHNIRLDIQRPEKTWVSDAGNLPRIAHYASLNRITFTFINDRLESFPITYHFRLYGESEWQRLQWLLLCWQLHKVPYRFDGAAA